MNPKNGITRVLCYGDSNTYGQRPDSNATAWRYEPEQRWTGILQQLLGDGFEIIEEGLNGRTTDLDHAEKPGKNGLAYLTPCLHSHKPLDVVVLMLGSNDLKSVYRRTAEDVGGALEKLIRTVEEFVEETQRSTQVILVSPIHIAKELPNFDAQSVAASKQLAAVLAPIARHHACAFVDASEVAQAGEDGLHLDELGNQRLAERLAKVIQSICGERDAHSLRIEV